MEPSCGTGKWRGLPPGNERPRTRSDASDRRYEALDVAIREAPRLSGAAARDPPADRPRPIARRDRAVLGCHRMSDPRRPSRRKDRLIQTRVPRDLESTLKEEARKRRLSVSHLIRNILEDAFHLVDGVVVEVDNLVTDSVGLAGQLKREAQRLASGARGLVADAAPPAEEAVERRAKGRRRRASRPSARSQAPPEDATTTGIADVSAWNPVILNRPEDCSGCARELRRGSRAFLGLSDDPQAPRVWLCPRCAGRL